MRVMTMQIGAGNKASLKSERMAFAPLEKPQNQTLQAPRVITMVQT